MQKGSLYEDLMALWQNDIVEEFRSLFKLIVASLRDALEEVLLFAFMNGLKIEIRLKVKLFHPTMLKEAKVRAQEIKEKSWVMDT